MSNSPFLDEMNTVKGVRVIIDFLRYVFLRIAPDQFRWDPDEKKTKIVIGAHEVFGLENAGAILKVAVVRSPYSMEHRTINQARPTANTFGQKAFSDLMDGTISVVVEAGTSEECTGLATFCGLVINANRHIIIKEAKIFHGLKLRNITEERTVDMQAKPVRIQCAAVLEAPMNISWITDKKPGFLFGEMLMAHMDEPVFKSHCSVTQASKILLDSNARFGYFNTDRPQFNEKDLLAGWYTVRFIASGEERKIKSVIAADKLELDSVMNSDGSGLEYEIVYNSMYFEVIANKTN
jgi:hypothetical protein